MRKIWRTIDDCSLCAIPQQVGDVKVEFAEATVTVRGTCNETLNESEEGSNAAHVNAHGGGWERKTISIGEETACDLSSILFAVCAHGKSSEKVSVTCPPAQSVGNGPGAVRVVFFRVRL
jgi:hypothetical protein